MSVFHNLKSMIFFASESWKVETAKSPLINTDNGFTFCDVPKRPARVFESRLRLRALYLRRSTCLKIVRLSPFPLNLFCAKPARSAINFYTSRYSKPFFSKSIGLISSINVEIVNFIVVEDYYKNNCRFFSFLGILILCKLMKVLIFLTYFGIRAHLFHDTTCLPLLLMFYSADFVL